jgi:transcriptional regulator with XRE-family HTH domain
MADPFFRKGVEEEYDKLSIAEQLVKLRLDSGLTQAELAKRVGTSTPAICRYENADYDRYEIQTIKKIVDACGGKLKIEILGPERKVS